MNLIARFMSAACAVVGMTFGACAQAADAAPVGNVQAGRNHAIQVCAQCHDVLSREKGALSKVGAPDFNAIANAKTTNAIGLNVFLVSPHPTMPNLIIAEQD